MQFFQLLIHITVFIMDSFDPVCHRGYNTFQTRMGFAVRDQSYELGQYRV